MPSDSHYDLSNLSCYLTQTEMQFVLYKSHSMIQNNLQLLKITSCASLPMIWRIWVQYSINTPITLKLVWLDYQMVLKLECYHFKCKMQRWSFGIFSMYPCSGSWGLVPISQIAQMPQIFSSIYNSHLEWPLGLRKPNWMQEILSWRM